MSKPDYIYCLVEKETKIADMKNDPMFLVAYVENGYSIYLSAEDAEHGRQAGDAYDEPGRTRVVGFRIMPFLPKKKMKIRKEKQGNEN